MKERPILFSAPMVRAILEGRKTQTRRVVNPQPAVRGWITVRFMPGDRLWVRETWMAEWKGSQDAGDEYAAFGILYRVGGCPMETDRNAWEERKCPPVEHSKWYGSWQPSIFMPRWASRITLEVTEVRVQRVQDITPDDCRAEGVGGDLNDVGARYSFGQLWNSINAKRGFGWDANPWVWAITFQRIRP